MLPYLNAARQNSKKYVVAFRGLNYGEGYTEGEFSATKNISTEAYPCVTQRYARAEETFEGKKETYDDPSALHIKDGILAIDGETVLFNGEVVEGITVETGRKHLAAVGNQVFIFPDKKYVEIVDGEVVSAKSMEVTVEDISVSFASDSIRKVSISPETTGLIFTSNSIEFPERDEEDEGNEEDKTDEENPVNDTDDAGDEDGENDEDEEEEKFALFDDLKLEKGDTVTITGCTTNEKNNKTAQIVEIEDRKLIFADNTFEEAEEEGAVKIICPDKEYQWPLGKGDSITISGCEEHPENNRSAEIIVQEVRGNQLVFLSNVFTANTPGTTETITINRSVPELRFICESNNRLWGVNGNTIYGSKFGDPLNFKSFGGTAGDSYYIDVGSEGEFTGCVHYSTHICFFKENMVHKLYGSKPANFQLVSSQVYGVQAGSERSLCIINETLFYKGVNGVYAYTGGVPELISDSLGAMRTSIGACAITDGTRYYLCVTDEEKSGLYVFDTRTQLWVLEDDLRCVDMAFHDGHVYFLSDGTSDKKLIKVNPDGSRADIEWSITFCPFHETVNERKGYSKFHLRMDLSAGAWLQAEIKRNTDTRWKLVYTTHNEREKTVTIPILPARCDSVEIRLSGKGMCKLRTLIREFFIGSDV